jgi:ABC-type transporter Mla MlaB component
MTGINAYGAIISSASTREPTLTYNDRKHVAIFGLFGKKDHQPAPADQEPSRPKRHEGKVRPAPGTGTAERSKQVQRNAARASATAQKIDAIESEMSSEFTTTQPASDNSLPGPSPAQPPARKPLTSTASPTASNSIQASPTSTVGSFLPSMRLTTEFLLGAEGKATAIEVSSTGAAHLIEEAAIMFANDQSAIVEQMLLGAIHDQSLDDDVRTAWSMLFDLYQITGAQELFENLSIDYASTFETSPPPWVEVRKIESQPVPAPQSGATPTVPFVGKLDGTIIKLLERAQKLGESSSVLRLEFARVTEVAPVGCGLLLRMLNKLQKSEHDLILVGAPELATKIRSILQVGRRDETEAPWLLLLEVLRLLNSEKEFEEASIDYCVTFEVSPPSFVAPVNKVTTAAEEIGSVDRISDSFMMPAVIDGRADQVIGAITEYVTSHNPAILDCSRLNRVDFNAATQLLMSLAPLCSKGKAIELRHVNHLVATLFNVMGLKDIARIVPRKP